MCNICSYLFDIFSVKVERLIRLCLMIDLVLFPNQSVKLHIQIRTYTGLISVLCINAPTQTASQAERCFH